MNKQQKAFPDEPNKMLTSLREIGLIFVRFLSNSETDSKKNLRPAGRPARPCSTGQAKTQGRTTGQGRAEIIAL